MTLTCRSLFRITALLLGIPLSVYPCGAELQTLVQIGYGNVESMAIAADNRVAIAGGGNCQVLDLNSGINKFFSMDDAGGKAAISANGATLVAISPRIGADDVVFAWDVATSQQLWRKTFSQPRIACVSPDGTKIALLSGSYPAKCTLYSAATGVELASIQDSNFPNIAINKMQFSPDGTKILLVAGQSKPLVLNSDLLSPPLVITGPAESIVDLNITNDNATIGAIFFDKTFRTYDALTGVETGNVALQGVRGSMNAADISQDNEIAVLSDSFGETHIFDLTTGQHGDLLTNSGSDVHLTADKSKVLLGNQGDRITLYDILTGEVVKIVDEYILNFKALSGNDQIVTFNSEHYSYWDIQTGQQLLRVSLPPVSGCYNYRSMNSNEEYLGFTACFKLHLWNYETEQFLPSISDSTATYFAQGLWFDDSGERVATGYVSGSSPLAYNIGIYSVTTGQRLFLVGPISNNPDSVEFVGGGSNILRRRRRRR
jgi:WD40 repeat protein